jgi:hypothetical protein
MKSVQFTSSAIRSHCKNSVLPFQKHIPYEQRKRHADEEEMVIFFTRWYMILIFRYLSCAFISSEASGWPTNNQREGNVGYFFPLWVINYADIKKTISWPVFTLGEWRFMTTAK